MYEGIIDKV